MASNSRTGELCGIALQIMKTNSGVAGKNLPVVHPVALILAQINKHDGKIENELGREGSCHSNTNLNDVKPVSNDEIHYNDNAETCAEEDEADYTETECGLNELERLFVLYFYFFLIPLVCRISTDKHKARKKQAKYMTRETSHRRASVRNRKLEILFGYEENKLELQKVKWNSTKPSLFIRSQNSAFTVCSRNRSLKNACHRQCGQRRDFQYISDLPAARAENPKCENVSTFWAKYSLKNASRVDFEQIIKNVEKLLLYSSQNLSLENIYLLWINLPFKTPNCGKLELKCICYSFHNELYVVVEQRYNEKNPQYSDAKVIHDNEDDAKSLERVFNEEFQSDKIYLPPVLDERGRPVQSPTSDGASISATYRYSEQAVQVVESDGRVADEVADPPGQQSVYVLPGNTLREDYRLSTFEKFPVTCPISRKVLAKSGFFYTGFVDRVKCFACSRTVERWESTDNPADLRWHKPTCPFPRGEECGNVPIMNAFHVPRGDEVIVQRDPATGQVIRTVTYPAGLPQSIRQSGGIFNVGPNNQVTITTGPPARPQSTFGNQSSVNQPLRPWRLGNVISADTRRFLTNLYKERELDRLASFARWPTNRPLISPIQLAKNGFIYLGDLDRTQCFSCGGVLRNWTANDDAAAEHGKHFPNCRMVRGIEASNIPVPTYPESQQERNTNYPCRYATNPHMRSEAGRRDTFDLRWQTGRISATPDQIAEAGFFYLGDRDRVKCWYCNGGLQNWEYDDVPWEEHAKWFPNCQFLLKMKGQHYVYNILRANPALARPIIARQRGSPLDPNHEEPPEDIPPSRIQAPVAPTIIDPREQMKKRKATVQHVMKKSEVVSTVLKMGFDEKIVAALIEDRLTVDNERNPEEVYESASELLDDVMKREEEMRREESERRQAAASAMEVATAGPSSLATVSSMYSSMPSTSIMSSIGPSPGSGKYNVSFYGDDDENREMEIYGSTSGEATALKLPQGAEANTQSIQAAMNLIEEERMCKICFTNPADMLFVPCSHMCCCMDCTQAIDKCPLCRREIDQAIKTYTN